MSTATTATGTALGTFVGAVLAGDLANAAGHLAGDVELRALLPSGLVERRGRADVCTEVARWFGALGEVVVVQTQRFGPRTTFRYCVALHDDDGGTRLMVQSGFADGAGRVERLDLVCSGSYRPGAQPG